MAKTNQTSSEKKKNERKKKKKKKSSPCTYSHTQTIRLIPFYYYMIIMVIDSYSSPTFIYRLRTIIYTIRGSNCSFECVVYPFSLLLIHSTHVSVEVSSHELYMCVCMCVRTNVRTDVPRIM